MTMKKKEEKSGNQDNLPLNIKKVNTRIIEYNYVLKVMAIQNNLGEKVFCFNEV